jgi:hypothetical protein
VQKRNPAVRDGQPLCSGIQLEDVVRREDDVQESRLDLDHWHGLAIEPVTVGST